MSTETEHTRSPRIDSPLSADAVRVVECLQRLTSSVTSLISQQTGGGLDDDAAARSDQEREVEQVSGDGELHGLAGLLDVAHGIRDVLARIELHLVDVAANTKKPVWSIPREVRDPDNPRITRTVRDVTDGHGNVTTKTIESRIDMRSVDHDSSPSVDGGSSPTVGDAGDAEGRAEPPAPASQDGETADPMIDLGASLRSAVHHRQYLRSQLKAANRRITKYSDDLQITQECVEDYERRLINHVVGEVK